jgi:hypothetical protein
MGLLAAYIIKIEKRKIGVNNKQLSGLRSERPDLRRDSIDPGGSNIFDIKNVLTL